MSISPGFVQNAVPPKTSCFSINNGYQVALHPGEYAMSTCPTLAASGFVIVGWWLISKSRLLMGNNAHQIDLLIMVHGK